MLRKRYPGYEVGVGSYGTPNVHDWHQGTTLKIGSYCSIARDVNIFLGGNHRLDWVSSFPFPEYYPELNHLIPNFGASKGDVIIGSDVWLGRNSTILSGVTIGHGAVIAAGAVITKNVEPFAIMAGNPAKCVKWRFDEEVRQALLASEWWEWPPHEIRSIAPMLCTENLSELLSYARMRQAQNLANAS